MVDEIEGNNFKSPEEALAAENFEGTDNETELSESAKRAVDIAWRAEGLEKVMQQKGDRRDFLVTIYVMTIFAESMPGKKPDEGVMSEASNTLEALCEEYGYDSGKRKYAKE